MRRKNQDKSPKQLYLESSWKNELDFQHSIVEMAETLGWLVFHDTDSRKNNAGFPDLVLLRERLVFAELKFAKNKPSPDQVIWLNLLKSAGIETYLWYPNNWDEIIKILQTRRQTNDYHTATQGTAQSSEAHK